jgi:ribosomal protein S18 acetylase RimI-like enzyme
MDAPPIVRPMTADEIAAFRLREIAEYTAEMVDLGGMVLEAAEAKARASDEALFPGGERAPGHHFLIAMRGDLHVGELWFGPPSQPGTCDAWIYAISIAPELRGQGLGRWLMLAGEAHAREHGVTAMGLNVFGRNAAAISLYQSLGYTVTAQQMVKPLG